MRLLVASIVIAPLLTGCGLSERFESAENRINTALPPDSGVQVAKQLLMAQVADKPDEQRSLTSAWGTRLRLRALSCSRDYTPTWRDSNADIRKRLENSDCFVEADRSLKRWLGLQRVRLTLAQDSIRPTPQALPPMISYGEFITTVTVARDAPVAAIQGRSSVDVVELASGKSIFKESISQDFPGIMNLSPNGRMFTQRSSGKVAIRASIGGEMLVELTQADGLLWLDNKVLALRSNNAASLRLLDLTSGDETPVPGVGGSNAFLAVPAPGAPNRFNLLTYRGADQIEIVDAGGRYEAQLRAEKRDASGRGFATNTGGVSADGTTWVDGAEGIRVLNLDTLELHEHSFSPVGTRSASPTPNPEEVLVAMHLPSGNGVTSLFRYYLYAYRAGTLAEVIRAPGDSTRYQYIAPIKRLALIDNQTIRYLDKVPAVAPQPAATVVAEFIDQMNQRRLAAAAAAAVAAQLPPMPAVPGMPRLPMPMPMASLGAPAPPGSSVATPLHAQLREAHIEGVGVYEGAGAQSGAGRPRTPGTVEVRVRRTSRPVGLVLSSYEPVRWIIITEPGARLSAVLLSGYHDSTVVGAGAARVYRIGSGYAYGQQTARYQELQRSVMHWAGKPIEIFQGRYQGSTFSVGGS